MKRLKLKLQRQDKLSDYVRAIAWSPNSEFLAACSSGGEVVLWQDSKVFLQPGDGLSIDCLGFSPDGQFLAVGGQQGIRIWQLQPGTTPPQGILVKALDYGSAWIDQLAWSPVENILAIGVGREVHLWQAETDQSETLEFEASSVLGIAWHPQGKLLAASGHKYVKVWDEEKAEPTRLDVPGASICAAWSKDGKYLASGNLDRTLAVLKWGSPPPWFMQGFPAKVSKVAWSEPLTATDAPLLAVVCSEGIAVWHREHPTEGNWQSQILAGHQGFVQAIAFQPGTFHLASAADDGSTRLWHQAKTLGQSLKGATGFSCLAWSSPGDRLAAGGQQGELLIWEQADRG